MYMTSDPLSFLPGFPENLTLTDIDTSTGSYFYFQKKVKNKIIFSLICTKRNLNIRYCAGLKQLKMLKRLALSLPLLTLRVQSWAPDGLPCKAITIIKPGVIPSTALCDSPEKRSSALFGFCMIAYKCENYREINCIVFFQTRMEKKYLRGK